MTSVKEANSKIKQVRKSWYLGRDANIDPLTDSKNFHRLTHQLNCKKLFVMFFILKKTLVIFRTRDIFTLCSSAVHLE